MKKFFAIAFIAVSVVACNNKSNSDKPAEDTTKKETPAPTPAPTNDTTNAGDTTHKADTAAPKM